MPLIGDIELPTEANPIMHALYAYWREKREGRRFPARKDLDPLDIPLLLPHLTIVDVVVTPPSFIYRLVGTAAAAILMRDLTGQIVGTGVKSSEIEAVLGRYILVRDQGAPLYHRTRTQETTNDYTLIDRLMLPLGEADAVTKILSMIIRVAG